MRATFNVVRTAKPNLAICLVILCLIGVGCSSSGAAPASRPVFETTTRKAQDIAAVRVEHAGAKEVTVVDVTSASGIGSATITLREGSWPDPLVLRLHLGGLESLAITAGGQTLNAAVNSTGAHEHRLSLAGGQNQPETPIKPDSPLWMEMKAFDAQGKQTQDLPGNGGYFEMTLPQVLLREKELSIGWIDFYR